MKEVKEFPYNLAAPAQRALANAGITTLKQITKNTEKDITDLHGMGPNAIGKIRKALHKEGLEFKQ